MLNAALIGLSGYSQAHFDLLRHPLFQNRIRLKALALIDPENHARTLQELTAEGVSLYPDHESMLEAEKGAIDLCMVPTPIHWHTRMTLAALSSGANVLVEKPLAGSLAEGESIARARDEAGKMVAIGFQECYCPGMHQLQRFLQEGVLGTLQELRVYAVWPRTMHYYSRNSWAGKIALGGHPVLDSPINNALSHYLHILLFLAGPQPGETARCQSVAGDLFRVQPIESFDTATVRIQLEHGPTLHVAVTHSGRETHHPSFLLKGSKGVCTWSLNGDIHIGTHTIPGRRHDQATRHDMMSSILNRLEGDPNSFIVSVESAMEHTRVVESLHRDLPILPMDTDHVMSHEKDGHLLHFVPGIEEILGKTHQEGSLLSETGVPWAAQSTKL